MSRTARQGPVFALKHVRRITTEAAGLERVGNRQFIDHRAAADVDDELPRLAVLERLGVDEVQRLCGQRCGDEDKISLRQRLRQRHRFDTGKRLHRVHAEHPRTAKTGEPPGDGLTDLSEPDHSHTGPRQSGTIQPRPPTLELAAAHLRVAGHQFSRHRD